MRKKAFWSLAIFAVGLVASMLAFFSIDPRLWILWPIFAIGVMIYRHFLRCPRCGQSIYKRRKIFLGLEYTYYGVNLVPRRCGCCGQDLSQTAPGKNPAVAT